MATCPNCGTFLGDQHRCRSRWWGVRALVIDLAICGVAVGTFAGIGFYVLDQHVSWPATFLTAMTGIVVRWAVIFGEPRRTRSRP